LIKFSTKGRTLFSVRLTIENEDMKEVQYKTRDKRRDNLVYLGFRVNFEVARGQ